MSTLDRAVTITLFVAAAIAVAAGIAVIILGQTLTRSRVATSTELLHENLQTAQRVVHTLAEKSDELETIGRVPAHAADAAQRLPKIATAAEDVMRAANKVMRHTAGSLRTIQSGVNFLTAGSPIESNAQALTNLAEQMSRMREVVGQSHEPVESFVDQVAAAVAAQRTLRRALAEAGVGPKLLETRLERTIALQERADLPSTAAWQQTGTGGLYLLVGLLLGGVGFLWRRIVRLDLDD